jgi:hypothetical protein
VDAGQCGLANAVTSARDLQAALRQARFHAAVGVVTQDQGGWIEILDETPGVAAHQELQALPGEVDRFFQRIFDRSVIDSGG